MVFCNKDDDLFFNGVICVTILILIDGFLQYNKGWSNGWELEVTILILIDGFLQYQTIRILTVAYISHNPYFNRWFSAIN